MDSKQHDERSFSIGDREFKLHKITPFKQFHVVRRVAPILGKLGGVLPEIAKAAREDGQTQAEQLDQLAKFLEPIMEGISKLSDADSEFVLLQLLCAVEMQQKQFDVWSRVANEKGIMFQDLELPVLLQCAGRAFMYNLSGFLVSLRRS